MYTEQQIAEMESRYPELIEGLERLLMSCVATGNDLPDDSRARDYLLHGGGRRINLIRRSLSRIFELFPLRLKRPLPSQILMDVQINLQAYVMNMYGLFDNWAWAFVIFHKLEQQVGGKFGVGFQREKTQKFLPVELRDYVLNERYKQWHNQYLKNYRDALAHRVPLYIPPARFTNEESKRYCDLESEKIACTLAHDFDRADRAKAEQLKLGKPVPVFLHSFNEGGPPKPILLHPQLLSDAAGVIELGDIFFANWKKRD